MIDRYQIFLLEHMQWLLKEQRLEQLKMVLDKALQDELRAEQYRRELEELECASHCECDDLMPRGYAEALERQRAAREK